MSSCKKHLLRLRRKICCGGGGGGGKDALNKLLIRNIQSKHEILKCQYGAGGGGGGELSGMRVLLLVQIRGHQIISFKGINVGPSSIDLPRSLV